MSMAKKSALGEIASAETKKEFADKLSSYTSLSAKEIEDLFPKQSDRDELVELMKIVGSAADENSQKAELMQKIGTVSGAVIKLAKKFAIGL